MPAVDPPNRTQRQRCWEARDSYYACLNALNIMSPGDEADKCSKEVKAFQSACAASWVSSGLQSAVFGASDFMLTLKDTYRSTTSTSGASSRFGRKPSWQRRRRSNVLQDRLVCPLSVPCAHVRCINEKFYSCTDSAVANMYK